MRRAGQVSPGNEAHLHAFADGAGSTTGGDAPTRSISTPRPNSRAKKLLAAGERRIFDFARVFRNRERGDLHAPEFTMFEWYRAGETYETGHRRLPGAAEAGGRDRPA